MVKISKSYTPKENEKYMCAKHLAFFKRKLQDWKTELKELATKQFTIARWMIIVHLQILLIKLVHILKKM